MRGSVCSVLAGAVAAPSRWKGALGMDTGSCGCISGCWSYGAGLLQLTFLNPSSVGVFRLEKPSKTGESNHQPRTGKSSHKKYKPAHFPTGFPAPVTFSISL